LGLYDIISMNNFVMGINSIGQLFPAPIPYSEYPIHNSAWEGVAKSFQQAGKSLWFAIKDCTDTKTSGINAHNINRTQQKRTHA